MIVGLRLGLKNGRFMSVLLSGLSMKQYWVLGIKLCVGVQAQTRSPVSAFSSYR